MKDKKIYVNDEIVEEMSMDIDDIVVGAGNQKSECKKSDYGKAVGVLYQSGPDIKIHNGRIIGCTGAGYIVKHCANASTSGQFVFDTFYFYNQYAYNHLTNKKKGAKAFVNIAISKSSNAIFYYGLKAGSKQYDTHNGVFVNFTYKDPKTGKVIKTSDYSVFLKMRYNPSSVIELVYDHYIKVSTPKVTKLDIERATATNVKHYGEIPYK